MNNKLVITHIENNIAFVTLNRPDKHNALNMAMFSAIRQTIKALKRNRDIRCVVVNGNGEDFCSGLDIKSVLQSPMNSVKLLFKWLPGQSNLAQYVSSGWREIPVPVIMVTHGRVWGGGLQIALGGDFRIADKNCEFSILEARWGLIPDMGGTLALKEHMSVDQAKYYAMTGETFCVEKAKENNLITRFSDNPMDCAKALAEKISAQSPDAVAGVKKLYNRAWWKSQRFALAWESLYQIKVMATKNQKIKTYNQLNPDSNPRPFKQRKNW